MPGSTGGVVTQGRKLSVQDPPDLIQYLPLHLAGPGFILYSKTVISDIVLS